MGATPSAASDQLWYVRRGEKIHGPYTWTTVACKVGLGRIHAADLLSQDQDTWRALSELMSRLPAHHGLAGSARDDRRLERRAERATVVGEQRVAPDRRASEDRVVVARRARSERVWAGLRPTAALARLPLLAVGLALSVSFALAWHYSMPGASVAPDCNAPAAPKVNWDFCAKPNQQLVSAALAGISARNARLAGGNLSSANLRGADLAYADLSAVDFSLADARHARMVGASLRKAVLNHARLTGADLSFSDLTGASLAGAELSATRLGNAIWIDGRVCARDSIGECETR